MDSDAYDAHDALLYHIFKQVRHDASVPSRPFVPSLFCRRKTAHPRRTPTGTQASAFVPNQANTAYSLKRTPSWSPSRRPSAS